MLGDSLDGRDLDRLRQVISLVQLAAAGACERRHSVHLHGLHAPQEDRHSRVRAGEPKSSTQGVEQQLRGLDGEPSKVRPLTLNEINSFFKSLLLTARRSEALRLSIY